MRYPRATQNVAVPAATFIKLRPIHVIIFVAVAVAGISIFLFKASPSVQSKQMTTVFAANRGGAYVNLQDGKALRVSKFDGPQAAADALRTGAASARSLTRADFDGNGTPDVVAGYALNNTGLLTVHRGNPEAYAPTDDSIYTRIQQGYNPEPLLPEAKVYQLTEPADFLATGDFNRDSEIDILAGSRNGSLFLLAGKDGVFEWPVAVSLPGALTALTTGEFRAADGKTDLAIAVNGFNGPQVLVYDGHYGLNGEPIVFQLSAPALAVEFGELDNDPFMDLSVAAGNEAVFIHGWGRKRDVNPQLQVEKLQLGFQARGMALGFFVWNRDAKKQVAILGDNGTTHIFHSGELRAQPFNEQELAERGKGRLRPKRTDEDVESVVGWQASAKQDWDAAREFHTNTDTAAPGNRLFMAHLSGAEIDNLMFMDSQSQVKVVQQFSQKYAPESVGIQGTTDISEASLSLVSQPTAILSMPPKINGERSLIMLQSGTPDLAVIVGDDVVVASSVDTTADLPAASACTAAGGDCSLRGAITRANTNASDPMNPAANVITVPNGEYVLSINGAGGCVTENNTTGNSIGDLEINNSTTITGGGMLTTIIRQTGTGNASFPGDRVMCLNVPVAANRDYVFSGFTIAGGFDRSSLGGGGLVGGAKDNFLSLTNIRITNNDNTALNNYAGGGLSITGGDVTITNSLIGGPTPADSDPATSNDRTDLTRGNYAGASGGGVGYSPGDPNGATPSPGVLTITGTTIQGNKAKSGAGGGGGADLFFHNQGTGSFTINGGSIIDSNTALQGNGGGVLVESLHLTVDSSTFTNNATVLADTRGGAIYLSGGGMSFGSSTSFSNNTVGAGVVLGKAISVNTGGTATTGVFVTGGSNNINDNVEVLPNGTWTNNDGTSVTFLNLTLAEGTFVANNSTLTVNQDLNLNNFGTVDSPVFTGGSGTHTITGNLNIVEGTYTATGATTNIAGNFNKTGGTFTHSSGTFNFNGTGAQTINGSPTFNILTVNKGSGTLTLLSSVGVASNLNLTAGTFDLGSFTANRTAAGGTMTLSANTLLKIGGTNGLPTNYTTHSINSTNTVEYSGTTQTVTVPNSGQSYGNLTTSGSGTKTLGGTLSAAGVVTIGSGTVLAGGTNTFNVGGNWVNNVGNAGYTSSGAGIVNFNGSGATLTGATTFTNLTISKTAGQTLTLGAPIIVNGNLLLTTGNLAAASNAISLAGNWTNNSGASAFSGTNTTTFTGGTANTIGGSASTAFNSVTVNKSGGTLSLLTNITIAGDLTVTAGTFDLSTFTANRTAAGGTLSVSNGAAVTIGGTNALPSNFSTNTFGATSITNFTGTNQNVAGITYGHLNLSGAGTKTLLGPATIAGSLTIASGTTFDSASNNINIGGNWTNNGGTFLPGTGTVTFDSTTAAQGIIGSAGATTQTFFGITVNKTGQILNVSGSTTALDINGNVTLTAGTFAAGTAATINVAGNWINNGGTFNGGTGNVILDGPTGQSIGGSAATTFNALTISSAGTGAVLGQNATVNGTLTLNNNLTTGANILIQPSTAPASVAGLFDVIGSVRRTGSPLPSAVGLTFGNQNNIINFTAAGTRPTDVTITLVKAAPATFTSAVQRTYTITPTGGSGYSATLRLRYLEGELNGNVESQLDLWRFSVSSFVDEQQTARDTVNNWVEKSGVTAFSDWTFATHVNQAPSVTPNPAATIVGVQTSAIVLDRQAIDTAFVTHFKITGITNGTLFKSDGLTQINNNDFITYAEGTAGVKFTPNSVPTGSFTVQASSDASGTGLSPGTTGTVNVSQGTTTTTITSDLPDPSSVGQVVAVNYTVAVATGSGTPTGTVTVTVSGGAETCNGTAAAGTCNITLTTPGTRTLTATYSGDSNFVGGFDTETHDVVGAPDAVDDNYSTFKNVPLNIGAPGVLTNDTGSPSVSAVGGCADLTAPFAGCLTAANGTVTVNADGSFSYTAPSAVFVGSDSFTYTATNAGGSDTATVNITVSDSFFINEVLSDPPGTDAPNEYIEFRGAPSATIPAGTYLVAIEGDSADNAGDVQTIINLSGLTFGTNGFLVLLQMSNTYVPAAGANVLTSTTVGFGGLPGTIWTADSAATDIEDASVTFMVIQTGTAPTLTSDIDTDDNGTPDGATFTGWSVIDSIGALDGTATTDRAYGAINYSNNTGTPGSAPGTPILVAFTASYLGRSGNTTGSAAADWVASGALGGAAPSWTLSATHTEPIAFANQPLNHIGTTNFDVSPPSVQSITRVNASPTNASTVDFLVTFSESVSGVDATDFALITTGGIATASVGTVSGSGATRTVSVNTGTGDGTIRLDVIDDDSIKDGSNNALGGVGAGNGNFITGQFYTIDKSGPTVTINQASGQADPTSTSPINFTVVFNEAVTNFATGDVTVSGAGATTGTVTEIAPNDGTTYNVAVTGMNASGSVTASLLAGVASDALGNLSQASSSSDNTVTFNFVTNAAPVLDNTGNMSLTGINEDVLNGSNAGTLVGDIILSAGGDRITDADAGAVEGIAVIAVDNTNGTWEFSINSGGVWTAFGSPSATTARLLAANATTRIRFVPNANFHGTVATGITFRAWDQTSGTNGNTADTSTNGGSTAFSTATETASIVVAPVADTPSVTNASTNEDTQTSSGLVITRNAADGAEVTHFKITGITNGSLFHNDGLTAIANNAFITFAQGNAGLRFTPAANSVANGSFTVQAATGSIDATLGGSTATATITVTAVNDAPSFQIASNPPAVAESAGAQTVNSFATNFLPGPVSATDEAGQTLVGYTVTQTGSTGTLAFTSGPSIDNAGTLTYTATNATSGTATFNVVATDSGSGTPPNVNQSAAVAFTITVNSANAAPVLDNTGNMSLTVINEDVPNASNAGTLVGDIILSAGGDRITDTDAGAVEGIAVIAVDNTNGTWEFSIDNGGVWTAFGSPSATTARLLAANATTRIRFVPNANFNGTVATGITFRAWDQTSGTNGNTADPSTNGGSTAFSTATETASITVSAVNDAPTANAQAVNTNEGTPVGITLTGSDVETAAGSLTFTVTVQPTNGVLSGTAPNLTYTPNGTFNGADSFKFTVTDTGDGASGPLVSAEATVSITVNGVNNGPVNTVPGAQTTARNTALTFSAANGNLISIADIDAGTNPVQVTLTATNGTFTLNGTLGLAFTVGDGTADATMTFTGTIANVNVALNGLVFTPTAGFTGAASLQIITNDQGNTGSGGALSDTDSINITVTAPTLSFSQATYSVAEDGLHIDITVNRTGDASAAASVDYQTSDLFGLASCATINVNASSRCDYLPALGTLNFAAAQTSRTFRVFVSDDVRAELSEVLTLTLSNPVGAGLGAQSTATLTITDHAVAPGAANPIDDPAFFIRMLYVDILSREPDTVGFANWLATLNGCPNGGFGNVNTTCDRVHVAKSFFGSQEFGERGFFVYRFYDAGLGQRPTYNTFLRGMQQIGGSLNPADSTAAKMGFVGDFMASAEFQTIYAGLLVPGQANAFITKLEQTSGTTIPEPTRAQLVSDMANGTKTPGQTLKAFMETPAVFNGFFNRGFVSMLYFGYLHRDPDTVGFDNWLQQLNLTNDYRTLTFGFIYSTEYRGRFGP